MIFITAVQIIIQLLLQSKQESYWFNSVALSLKLKDGTRKSKIFFFKNLLKMSGFDSF